MKKPEIKNITKIFGKVLKTLGKHAFMVSLILIFLASAIGVLVFYKYSIQAAEKEIEFTEKTLWLEEDALQRILLEIENREARFNQVEIKECPDLFGNPLIEEEKELTE